MNPDVASKKYVFFMHGVT